MRIVGFRTKCNRLILISDSKINGDCLIREDIGKDNLRVCEIDESCRLPERIKKFISRYVSS